MLLPTLACPTCGTEATSLHGESGRQYESDPPKPARQWLEPCGHDITRDLLDDYRQRFRAEQTSREAAAQNPAGGTPMTTPTPQAGAPVVGAHVLYMLNDADADVINRRRADYEAFQRHTADPDAGSGSRDRSGHQGHAGNHVTAGEVYPAVVVRVFDTTKPTANLQVLLDGYDTHWATSATHGNEPGQWSWRQPPEPRRTQ